MPAPRPTRPVTIGLLVSALLIATLSLVAAPSPAGASAFPVMAPTRLTAAQIAGWYRSTGKVSQATVGIDDLAAAFIEEGAAEGVAGDIAFAQSMVETGYLGFSSRVPGSTNNFSGLGAVDGGTGAATFPSARIGVRAQIQHLRAYADPTVTVARLANPLVDPRFRYVAPFGRAPYWEQYGGGIWASDPAYASKVLGIYAQMRAWAGATPPTWGPFVRSADLVHQAYADILHRSPTPAEHTSQAARLDGGALTAQALHAELVADEGARHAAPITRLYLAALGRLPDRAGLTYWTTRHREGVSALRLAQHFLRSSEFVSRWGTPGSAGYIDLLYRNVLGRPADASGQDYWQRRLHDLGWGWDRLLLQFSESPEHLRSSAVAVETSVVYLGMLRRQPDASVLSWWATRRSAGAALVVLTDLVYTSAEYANRFR